MLDFIRFVIRNPKYVTASVRKAWKTRKAMNTFRKLPENGRCSYCGRSKKLEVHHIEPVSVAADKADDPDNMIMLCRKPACHQMIGHEGDFRSRYVENVRELCQLQKVVKTIAP